MAAAGDVRKSTNRANGRRSTDNEVTSYEAARSHNGLRAASDEGRGWWSVVTAEVERAL